MTAMPNTSLLRFILGSALLAIGCDLPPRPILTPPTPVSATAEDEVLSELDKPPSLRIDPNWETWDVYYVGGKPVGYNHVTSTLYDVDGRVEHKVDNVLFVSQGHSRIIQRLQQTSNEGLDGRFLGFDASLQVGPVVTEFRGEITERPNGQPELTLITERGTDRKSKRIDWRNGYRGLVAIEQTLRDKPMTERGETRQFPMLFPGHYVVVNAKLTCGGPTVVPMLSGQTEELFEISYQIEFPEGGVVQSTIWAEETGRIVRTFAPAINLVSYRTNSRVANMLPQSLDHSVVLPVNGTIEEPEDLRRVGYEIRRVRRGNRTANAQEQLAPLSDLIRPQPNQFVRQSDEDDLIQVIVSRIGDKSFGGFEASDLEPTQADRKASRLVNFNHSLVKRFAGASVRSNTRLTETEVAEQMLQTAMSAIEYDPRDASYASASDVARAGKSGRFGRAVFYAALLRAKRLPARLAVGLKVIDGTPSKLVDDIWVLVYADERWTAMDVTEGRIAAPDRIILSTTSLTDQETADALTSTLKVPPRVKVKVFRTQK